MSREADALALLERLAARTPKMLVALSGKDSIVVAELAARTWGARNVICWFGYHVLGLECLERPLERVCTRLKVELLKVPHWALTDIFKEGRFRPHLNEADDWPDAKYADTEAFVCKSTGIGWTAKGERVEDSMIRRAMLLQFRNKGTPGIDEPKHRVYPVWDWSRRDVWAYIRRQRLPMPNTLGSDSNNTGFGFTLKNLTYIRDHHPGDWRRVLEVFPFAEAIIKRAEYYPTKEETDGH